MDLKPIVVHSIEVVKLFLHSTSGGLGGSMS